MAKTANYFQVRLQENYLKKCLPGNVKLIV